MVAVGPILYLQEYHGKTKKIQSWCGEKDGGIGVDLPSSLGSAATIYITKYLDFKKMKKDYISTHLHVDHLKGRPHAAKAWHF